MTIKPFNKYIYISLSGFTYTVELLSVTLIALIVKDMV